jgi:AcrR family transcriptional regulator
MSTAVDTRTLILDAAEEIAREQGLGAISMRGIAQKTGLSAPAAYRHFKSKEDLVESMVLRGYRGFEAGLEAARSRVSGPAERLGIAFRYYLEFWTRDKQGFELMADRGGTKNGLSALAIAAGSFGDLPADVAALLGRDVQAPEAARIGRWTAAALYGIALSFSADLDVDAVERKRDIKSAAAHLIRAVIAAAKA